MSEQAIEPTVTTLSKLQKDIAATITAAPGLQQVWIVAETSDVAVRGGHCYMELIEKDPKSGATVAKARAIVWAYVWRRLSMDFLTATGQQFASGLKVMVKVSARYHDVYGMSLEIDGINPSYTLGERERKRQEILSRLKQEGVYDYNRSLEAPRPCLRIAVISAEGAAGYGDFMNQLKSNARGFKFATKLFPAIMQGGQVSADIRRQLDVIASQMEQWDCVCIIRGGGSSTDLDGFDDYELANNVAQFVLPVIVGIGHERDTTVLDYIAKWRVKTPTAAAELLINMAEEELGRLYDLAAKLQLTVSDALGGAREQLAYLVGVLPTAPFMALQRAAQRLTNGSARLGQIAAGRIQSQMAQLERYTQAVSTAANMRLVMAAKSLDSTEQLIKVLSPQAVLSRGYSITRVGGHAVTDPSQVPAGTVITTELAKGTVISTVN